MCVLMFGVYVYIAQSIPNIASRIIRMDVKGKLFQFFLSESEIIENIFSKELILHAYVFFKQIFFDSPYLNQIYISYNRI